MTRRPDGVLEHLLGVLAALLLVPLVALVFLFFLPALLLRPVPAGKGYIPVRLSGKNRESAPVSDNSLDS